MTKKKDQGGSKVLVKHIQETKVFSIECCICGLNEEDDCVTYKSELASNLYKEGWRVALSEKFDIEGLMCPECSKKPDEERGD